MDNKKIGSFIAELRRQKQMTQNQLASFLDVTNKAVSRWECGEGYPEISIIPVLAGYLGVTVDELLAGERKSREDITAIPEVPLTAYQGNSLLEKAHHKFDNLCIISMALIITGIICFFSITLTFHYATIGFATAIVFFLASGVVFYIGRNNLLLSVKWHEQLTGENSFNQEIKKRISKRIIYAIWILMIAMFILLPYIVLGITSFGIYLLALPIFLPICAGLTFYIVLWLQKKYPLEWGQEDDTAMQRLEEATQGRHIHSFKIISLVYWSLWIPLFGVGHVIFTHPVKNFNIFPMQVGIFLGYIAVLVFWLIKDKSWFYRGWVCLLAVRNILFSLFVTAGITNVYYSSSSMQVGWKLQVDFDVLISYFLIAVLAFAGISALLHLIKLRLSEI